MEPNMNWPRTNVMCVTLAGAKLGDGLCRNRFTTPRWDS